MHRKAARVQICDKPGKLVAFAGRAPSLEHDHRGYFEGARTLLEHAELLFQFPRNSVPFRLIHPHVKVQIFQHMMSRLSAQRRLWHPRDSFIFMVLYH